MKILPPFAALLFIVGCTTVGKPYTAAPPPPQGKAVVYFMRTAVGYGNFWTTVFSVNDAPVVSLYDKGYSWIHLDAGVYKFSTGTTLNSGYLKFVMPVQSGREYFIEYNQESAGAQKVRNVIRSISPADGNAKVTQYAYKEADKADIPSKPKE